LSANPEVKGFLHNLSKVSLVYEHERYKNGEYLTIDLEKAIYNAEKETKRILGELK
jgi:hypothetical protein